MGNENGGTPALSRGGSLATHESRRTIEWPLSVILNGHDTCSVRGADVPLSIALSLLITHTTLVTMVLLRLAD